MKVYVVDRFHYLMELLASVDVPGVNIGPVLAQSDLEVCIVDGPVIVVNVPSSGHGFVAGAVGFSSAVNGSSSSALFAETKTSTNTREKWETLWLFKPNEFL